MVKLVASCNAASINEERHSQRQLAWLMSKQQQQQQQKQMLMQMLARDHQQQCAMGTVS
jgi:ubiquitin